jgi:arylsulfatase A-like enzyme
MLERVRPLVTGVDSDANDSRGVATVLSRARDRLRTQRADQEFRHRSITDVEPAVNAPRHVVCVVVDALRADTVDESLTPYLASLSGTAAVSPSTWTFPAVTALLSGRYPHAHGAVRRVDGFEDSVADVTSLPPRPDPAIRLLPERLAGAGYRTRGTFAMIVPFLALSGRFDSHVLYRDAPAERLLADHLEWLTDHRDERTFSYVHLGDLHEPVDPPADYWMTHEVDETIPDVRTWRFEDVVEPSPTVERYRVHRRRLYRAAAEYVDNRVSSFRTRADELLSETLFVVAGDHGEAFWEHAAFHADRFADPRPAYCVGHGGAPYESVTRVPLCVDGSAIETETVAGIERGTDIPAAFGSSASGEDGERRSLIDVAPTVLEAVGLDVPSDLDGTAVTSPVDDRRLLVESARYGYEKRAVYDGDLKLIASRGDDVTVGLSLPDETPLTLSPERETELLEALPSWPSAEAAADGRDDGRTISWDVERRLDQLGYR